MGKMTKNSLGAMSGSIEKIIAHVEDAIVASGKRFHEIPQEVIEGFLNNSGISMDQAKKVYKLLKEEYSSKQVSQNDQAKSIARNIVDTRESTMPKTPEYVEKIKSPRKSVFGEIKKIA